MTEETVLTAQIPTEAAADDIQTDVTTETTEVTTTEEGQVETTAENEEKGGEEEQSTEFTDFELPEGVELDSKAMEAALPIFKELNLNQEQAQKLVNLQADFVQRFAEQQEANDASNLQAQAEQWAKTARDDPDMGGAKFDETKAAAIKGMGLVMTDELKDFLNESGMGNHPELIRAFAKVGKSISEDGVSIAANVSKTKSTAEVLYGQQ